ncbi:hypothetical protein KKD62_01965 [Patescibacteria group bacterium]|nr:hypothetical protein [Patescibacteria group bacterium]MBU1931231.1 hypothetical protein [Patescibacteria group bacterium]
MKQFIQKNQRRLVIFLLLVFFGHLGWRMWQYRVDFNTPWDADYWRQRYEQSQWIVSDSKQGIGDDALYAHAGWQYLHGTDPTLINPEVPPLGKYLIGLSLLVFKNMAAFGLLSFLLAFGAFFLVNRLFFPPVWALLPVVLLSLEKLFYQEIRAPFLDLLYLSFFLLTSYFFLKARKLSDHLLSGFFLGCFVATKFSLGGLLVVMTQVVYLIWQKRSRLIYWLASLLVSAGVFFLSYFKYLQNGHSLLDVLRVQKWIWHFYAISQAKSGPLAVFRLLLLNQWPVWWQAEPIKTKVWFWSWPVFLVIPFVSIIWLFRRRKKSLTQTERGLVFLTFWLLGYLIFLMFTPVWPRYLLLYFPPAFTSLFLLLKLKGGSQTKRKT